METSSSGDGTGPARRYRSENKVHALFAQLDALMSDTTGHNPYNLPAPEYRGTTPAEEEAGGRRARAAAKATSNGATRTALEETQVNPLRNSSSDAKAAFFAGMRKQQTDRESPAKQLADSNTSRYTSVNKNTSTNKKDVLTPCVSPVPELPGFGRTPSSAPEKGSSGASGKRDQNAFSNSGNIMTSLTTDDVDAVMVGTPSPSYGGGGVRATAMSSAASGPNFGGSSTSLLSGGGRRNNQKNVSPHNTTTRANGNADNPNTEEELIPATSGSVQQMTIGGGVTAPASQAGIPSSAHGRLFPFHALASPGTPLSVLMMNAMRQYESGVTASGAGGLLTSSSGAAEMDEGAYEALVNEENRLYLLSRSGGEDLGMSPPGGATRRDDVSAASSTYGSPDRSALQTSGSSRHRNRGAFIPTLTSMMPMNRYGSNVPPSAPSEYGQSSMSARQEDGSPTIYDDDDDEEEEVEGIGRPIASSEGLGKGSVVQSPAVSPPSTAASGVSRTNSRTAMRLSEATALDSELQVTLKAMEETRRQREFEREARREKRRARAIRGYGEVEEEPIATEVPLEEDELAETSSTLPPAAISAVTSLPVDSSSRSPHALKQEQARLALARAELEDREAFGEEEASTWHRLLQDAAASEEEATIVGESRHRAELKRLALHLASDDSREREKRRIFEIVRDCIFDEDHARPEVVSAEGAARKAINVEFRQVLMSNAFQCQVDERLERLELFDFLQEEARRVIYECFVEEGEATDRARIQKEWFDGVAQPFKRTQDAQARDESLLMEAVGRVDIEDSEEIDRHILREMYFTDILPIIERDSWKIVNAEVDERLLIEREEPGLFLAIITNPEDETPFLKSRPMVKWYTQTVSKAKKDWLEHVTAKVKVCSDEELSGRLLVHQEHREEWILFQETFKRDLELVVAEVARREEFDARVALAEAERRREAEERLEKQGVSMPQAIAKSVNPKDKSNAAAPNKGAVGKKQVSQPTATRNAPAKTTAPAPKRSPSVGAKK